jgi:two-component system chemotaxis response regulator CheB
MLNPFDAVVVVGSQGALKSFQVVLGGLTGAFPAAIVFDLHRGADYGLTADLLRRGCPLRVRPAAAGSVLDPSIVFLAPHDQQLTILEGSVMELSDSGGGVGHPFADALLASAARVLGSRLIAVVLSGRLEGGACGVREVKRRGGRVIVEDPQSAVAPSMPNAALATGCVDFVLSPEGIANALVAMCSSAGAAELFRVRLNAAITS